MKYTPRKSQPTTIAGAPLWFITFSDMMTLLLSCFVLLLSFATVSPSHFEDAARSLNDVLGTRRPVPANAALERREAIMARIEAAARELRRQLQIEGRDAEVEIKREAEGVLLRIPAERLFDPAGTNLQPDGLVLLQWVARMVDRVSDRPITISGHVENRALTAPSAQPDNVERSYILARQVYDSLQRMTGEMLTSPVVNGVGDRVPLARDSTEAGRSRNRRVEIFVHAAFSAVPMNPAPGGQTEAQ